MGDKYTDAQKKASIKYLKEKTDSIQIRTQKGTKERWKEAAAIHGKSLNQFIVDTIDEKLSQAATECPTANKSGGGILTPLTAKMALEASQSAEESVPQFVERAVMNQAQRDKLTRGLRQTGAEGEH